MGFRATQPCTLLIIGEHIPISISVKLPSNFHNGVPVFQHWYSKHIGSNLSYLRWIEKTFGACRQLLRFSWTRTYS